MLGIGLPDLANGQAYEVWLQRMREAGLSLEVTIGLLEEVGTPVAALRAALLALEIPGTDTSRGRQLALKARLSGSKDISAFAEAVLAYALLRDATATEGSSERRGAPPILPGLHATLERLRTQDKATTLGLEAEVRLQIAISNAYQQLADFSSAERHASQALLLAESLRLPLAQDTALSCITCSLVGMGRLSESLGILREQIERWPKGASPRKLEEHHRFMADALLSLGDHWGAIEIVERLHYLNPELAWAKAYSSLFRCLIGVAEAEVGIDYEWAGLYRNVTEAVSLLVLVGSLPQLNTYAAQREAYLRRVIELTRAGERVREPWTTVMEAWARSLAFLWLGEPGRAGAAVRGLTVPFKEFLDLRLLLAAMRLELSFQLADPGIMSARQAEAGLRAVFEDAAGLPYAARTGLAERLKRWHPLVAAYAAVMPEPIAELAEASEMILRLEPSPSAYGVPLPPVYAAELVLRSLRMSEKHFAQAPLNKAQILQRDALMSHHGEVAYWRSVVSGAHLILALLKAADGCPDYLRAAQNVAADFGVVPRTKADYARAQLRLVKDELTALLSGKTNPPHVAETLLLAPVLA